MTIYLTGSRDESQTGVSLNANLCNPCSPRAAFLFDDCLVFHFEFGERRKYKKKKYKIKMPFVFHLFLRRPPPPLPLTPWQVFKLVFLKLDFSVILLMMNPDRQADCLLGRLAIAGILRGRTCRYLQLLQEFPLYKPPRPANGRRCSNTRISVGQVNAVGVGQGGWNLKQVLCVCVYIYILRASCSSTACEKCYFLFFLSLLCLNIFILLECKSVKWFLQHLIFGLTVVFVNVFLLFCQCYIKIPPAFLA